MDPRSEWPREESNLRTQLRRLPLYPLSYGALLARVAEGTRTPDHRDHNTADTGYPTPLRLVKPRRVMPEHPR